MTRAAAPILGSVISTKLVPPEPSHVRTGASAVVWLLGVVGVGPSIRAAAALSDSRLGPFSVQDLSVTRPSQHVAVALDGEVHVAARRSCRVYVVADNAQRETCVSDGRDGRGRRKLRGVLGARG